MINFNLAREAAFTFIAQTNTIDKVVTSNKTKTSGVKTLEWWKVVVEVPVGGRVQDFTLEVEPKPDFPLSLPEIRLSESDYQTTKYLPHIDSLRNICLFDKESIKLDTEQPGRIVKDCLNQAVRIIADGLNKDRSSEFNNEIIAYWEDTYHPKDVVSNGYLGEEVSNLVPGRVMGHYLDPAHGHVNIYLGTDSADSRRAVDFFKMSGHTVEECDAFYLGEINQLAPPFYLDNKGLLEFLEENFSSLCKQARSYLNRGSGQKILVFSLPSVSGPLFFGYYLYPCKTEYKGWRSASLDTVQIMSMVEPMRPVTRLRFSEFSLKRFRRRTDGLVRAHAPLKLMMAGLGSIGSNLLYYLSTLDVSNYLLVDPEPLLLENINRHLMSFYEVGMDKVDAVARFLTYNNPFLGVKKYAVSVVEVIQRYLAEINEMDLIFCAIGNDAIEEYILQCLANGQIEKPVMLFWVEPYLLGAHVLYVCPTTTFTLKSLESDGFYQFNILAKETYQDAHKQLSLREAGCQSSYAPYGKEAIAVFFAVLLPHLFNLIKNPPKDNLAFTYAGDLNLAAKLGLKISDFGNKLTPHQLIMHTV